MWRVVETKEFTRQRKWYDKKRGKESIAVSANLRRLMEWLDGGNPLHPFAYGFMHDEPAGVIAITEKGHGKNVAATRLYLYAYVERETVYLLTIGDKRSQNDDVQNCKRAVQFINENPDFGIQADEATEDEG